MRGAAFVFLLVVALGCVTARDELWHAQTLYDDARYEETLAWLAALDPERRGMDGPDRTRFYYLRGMAEFRLGQRTRAAYDLMMAAELVARDRHALGPERRAVIERAQADLARSR